MKLRTALFLMQIFLLTASPVQAQEQIELSDSDLSRLGIVLSTVNVIDNSSGARFPATIINSPLTTSVVTIPYGGILQNWLVTPGQEVQIGEALIMIQSQDLLELQNQWTRTQSELQQANFELQKDRMLLEQGIISEQRFMQTQRMQQQSQSSLAALRAKLVLAGFSDAGLQSLSENNSDAGLYTVRSPVNGKLDHLMANAGTYADSYTTIASIGSNERWLSAQVPARVANSLQIGQMLRVAGNNITLVLRQKDFEIDTQSQTVEIKAAFNAMPDLLPGQIVTLIIPPTESGILIPGDAVVHSGDNTTVYVRNASGFEVRALNLSPAGADYMAREGIAAGEQIVIRGAAILKGIQLGLGGE
tara:strand:- start:154 stop:1236 length:1083 start_codon:yes stop_codon:yes gene_type:complete